MDTTRLPSSYENATYLDYVESTYKNVTNVDSVKNHDSDTVHGIDDAIFNSAPVWLIVLIILICTWTIVANGLVFFCLVSNRNALKNNVNLQLLSLCITDMLVGIFTIPGALMPMIILNSKYETCAFLVYMFFLTQSATLGHTLLICVNRLLTIKRKTNVNANNNVTLKTICIQILAVWVGSLMFFGVHFLAFARFGETVKRCSSVYLFRDNHAVASALLTAPLLVPSHLCINIIYVYLLIYIRRRLRSINIVMPNHPNDDVMLKSYRVYKTHSSNMKTLGDVHTSHPSVFEGTKGLDSSMGYTQTKIRPFNEAGTSSSCESKRYGNNTMDRDVQETAFHTRALGGGGTERSRTNNNRVGLEKQKHVLVTFGILLISLNVFMTPLDFLAIIEMFNNGPLPRSVRFVCAMMAMLNSALNPVINIWRIKPFRLIIREKVMKICEFLSFRQT